MNRTEALMERSFVHGHAGRGKKGRLYNIWIRMRQRCNDPNTNDFRRYGGEGVEVCELWASYINFHDWAMTNGYRDDLTIDRIDNDGNYEPGNCRWTTAAVQARNKRTNHLVTYRGKTKTLAEWSELTGIDSSLLRYRLKRWPVNKAIETPAGSVTS